MPDSQIKRAFKEMEYTPENIMELKRCMNDPIYFIEKYVKVQHPTKGTVPMELYEYQKEMIDSIHNNKDSIILASRQMGKCFSTNTVIDVIEPPKGLKKIILKLADRKIYDSVFAEKRVPINLEQNAKPGIISFLKHKIVLTCLKEKTISVATLAARSNVLDTKIDGPDGKLKFTGEGHTNLFVKTPTGWSPISRVLRTIPYKAWQLEVEDQETLTAADDHIIMSERGQRYLKKLKEGELVHTKLGLKKVLSVKKLKRSETMYDLELADDNHVFYTNGILSHNTTVVAVYILWMTCFLDDKLCVIASKALNHAVEIVSRIKFAYEELPAWLKPGCRYYSRTSIEFDNGSKIKSEATSEKTGRGGSPSLLFIDEIAFLRRRIQDEMWASIAPSLSTGGKFIVSSTPNTDSDLFAQLWRGANSGVNSFVPVKALWYQHPERGEEYYKEMVGKLGELRARIELDCEFLSTDPLLIDSIALAQIRPPKPDEDSNGVKLWYPQKPLQSILLGVDIGTGTGKDYSTAVAFSFPDLQQIAEIRTNNLNISKFYGRVSWLIKKLQTIGGQQKTAEITWSFENNGVGAGFAALYFNDDNPPDGELISSDPKGLTLGVNTNGKTKLLACLQLKSLVERTSNGITINSDALLFELKNYVSAGASYAAKTGCTDDLVAATLVVMQILSRLADYDENAHKKVYDFSGSAYDPLADQVDDPEDPIPFVM